MPLTIIIINIGDLTYLSFSLFSMILKFIKAQIFDPAHQGRFIVALVKAEGKQYQLLTSRKIRHGVSNFYGECLHLPLPQKQIQIGLYFCPLMTQNFSNSVAEFKFQVSQYVQKSIYYGNVQYQKINCKQSKIINKHPHNQVKLYIKWEIQAPFTRKSSQCSRDLFNIQTPKKQQNYDEMDRQWRHYMKIYSPVNKKRNLSWIFTEEAVSEKCDSKRISVLKASSNQINNSMFKKILKSKSLATRSKTPEKKQFVGVNYLKLSLPLNHKQAAFEAEVKRKTNQKVRAIDVKDDEIMVQKRKSIPGKRINQIDGNQKIRRHALTPTKRRPLAKNGGQSGINKVGMLLASTVGVFAGLLATLAVPY